MFENHMKSLVNADSDLQVLHTQCITVCLDFSFFHMKI